jgi:hypothetical protein
MVCSQLILSSLVTSTVWRQILERIITEREGNLLRTSYGVGESLVLSNYYGDLVCDETNPPQLMESVSTCMSFFSWIVLDHSRGYPSRHPSLCPSFASATHLTKLN